MGKKNIPNELVSIAYDLSKKIFEGKLERKVGKEQLIGNGRMNPNSANHYIDNFSHMIKGTKYSMTNNAYSTEYFLENIYRDYGPTQLTNALRALQLHIKYYEELETKTKKKCKMSKQQAIYNKYELILRERSDEQELKA
jgi:5-methylcytosine-specific restriction enzyme A